MKTFITACLMGCILLVGAGCGSKPVPMTFSEDVAFLREHTDVIVLEKGDCRVAVVPEYQGRVMTSTVSPQDGPSFGWLKYCEIYC